jgi:hypothetical protein
MIYQDYSMLCYNCIFPHKFMPTVCSVLFNALVTHTVLDVSHKQVIEREFRATHRDPFPTYCIHHHRRVIARNHIKRCERKLLECYSQGTEKSTVAGAYLSNCDIY